MVLLSQADWVYLYDGGYDNDIRAGFAVGDADQNGELEIGVGKCDGGTVFYCLDEGGSEEWERDMGSAVHRAAALCDIDGDNALEYLVPQENGEVLTCLGPDGSLEWQVTLSNDVHDPVVADVDDDGCSEILVGTAYDSTGNISEGGFWVLEDPGDQSGCGALYAGQGEGALKPTLGWALVPGGVRFNAKERVVLRIYSPSGRLIASLSFGPGSRVVPLPPGVYLWRAGAAKGTLVAR